MVRYIVAAGVAQSTWLSHAGSSTPKASRFEIRCVNRESRRD